MKIKQWLDYLPTDIRSKAIANTHPNDLDIVVDSLSSAIRGAFYFDLAPEGQEYWIAVLDGLDEPVMKAHARPEMAMPELAVIPVCVFDSDKLSRPYSYKQPEYRHTDSNKFDQEYDQ